MELLFKIEKTIYQMYQKLNRMPNLNELEKELHFNINKIKYLMNYIFPVLSLDNAISPNSEISLMDRVKSIEYQPEEEVFNHELIEYELKILKSLVKKESEVLKYRYGFHDGRKHTLKKVGKKLGLSSEGVRQIELKALNRIKSDHSDLKDYLIH